jgi:hypothetical protein
MKKMLHQHLQNDVEAARAREMVSHFPSFLMWEMHKIFRGPRKGGTGKGEII